MLLIKNCNMIFLDKIKKGSILVENGKISKINPSTESLVNDITTIDGDGLYLSPGFIDVHIHGAGGYDTMDGTYESINNIAKTIVKNGTTSFLPTTMTVSIPEILQSVSAIAEAKKNGTDGANVLGAHLEGPFISPDAIGAQNPKYIEKPSIETFKKMVGNNEDAVVSLTLAPEIEGAKELIEYLSNKNILCSIGHTKATYNQAMDGIKWGARHATHLFNAMTPLHHRNPGVVGAVFDSDITTETISDGIHISYPVLRTSYKIKGTDKVLLITDAMMACCMPDGEYSLGGQIVIVKDGAARLKTGSLAGSVLTLNKAIKNIYENTNYPLYEIVKMATYNGAKHCKVDDRKGLIKEGYDADLVVFDEDINIKTVIVNGKIVHQK
ncbi:N-acetylglucosamine-6-phosphate deacetylase [Clostridium fallax]|uniref:N-acetylglucosamine-6-phosphate deacetylase n=1 Tax=Clostridium fallax TaxID=1533 RepID=A0A1M4VEE7_9CLOT|nr:N-acetylglucosamine-6-phosphate deacetylase [Clostridium fallax]SHE67200.1 N-acetylglucosamine 6-phosphate deacetylase [Clostridium fallax]SQB05760.1 N-acetylglucosamine-6-phosphate deacetylase [Clostridium fallax]